MRKKYLLTIQYTGALLLLLMIRLSVHAQVLTGLKNSFEQYSESRFSEKLFVHTDKSFYMAGEILWFKVYNVDAGSNKPADISKVAYIDVLDNENNPVLQAKIALKKGRGTGSLYIPVNISNGSYRLRAYTSWMKNFDPDLYFEKVLTIINPLKTPETVQAKPAVSDYDVQFFPEGGHLVNGLKSKVAFKAVGPNGKGVPITGIVVNERNDTIARLQSLKFGMGHFTFTPVSGNSYKAVLRGINNNDIAIKPLPAASTDGYVMEVARGDGNQVSISVNTAGIADGDIYLVAHSGNKVTAAQQARLTNSTARFTVDKTKLGDGITHFTLFNSARRPVCERLFFKRPKALSIATGLLRDYATRQKIDIAISTNGAENKPRVADLSLAVYRADSLGNGEPSENIFNYLWLSSELRGNIESPDFYFNSVNEGTDDALDNLMLTQGWSRYNWADVLDPKPLASFKFLPEYTGHIITGKLTNNRTGTPAPNILAYLGVTGKRIQLYGSKADSAGRILFNTKDFYGNNELVLQTDFEQDSIYHIDINSPFSEQYSSRTLPEFILNRSMKNQLEAASLNMQIENIYAGTMLRRFYAPQIDSTAFFGVNYKNYYLDDFTRFTTMEEVMREYVGEVNILRRQKRFHIRVINRNGYSDVDPLVMLDGVPVFNIDKVFTIDPLKVKRLQDIDHTYYWGPIKTSGIFSFTTYKGDLGGLELDPRALVLDYEGMQMEREFYSPVYDTPEKQKSHVPDFRNLLYWSPDILTNQQGKASATFYTSDQTGTYIGVLQGITNNGEAGARYFIFNVKK